MKEEETKPDTLATITNDTAGGALATMANAPEAVLLEAQKAATALKDVISRKPRPVMMGDEQYLEFEDWQTLGRFYGITAGEEQAPEFVQLGEVSGFKATAVALYRGDVISRATAYCLDDEEKWGTRPKYVYAYVCRSGGTSVDDPGRDEIVWEKNPFKEGKKRPKKERVRDGDEKVPLFQLSSMAQTRANAKVLRNVLSWVAVLAGYRPTPAEEMESLGAAPTPRAPDPSTPPSASVACPHCGSADYVESQDGKTAVCAQPECGKGWNLGGAA